MIIPDPGPRQNEFIRWVLDICLTSKKDRKDLYDRRRQFFLYGTAADQEVIYNRIDYKVKATPGSAVVPNSGFAKMNVRSNTAIEASHKS
jgi:hypothetical protein